MVALVLGCLGSLLIVGGGSARRVSARGSFAPAEMMTASGGGPMGDPFLVVGASNEQLQASVAYNSQDEEYLVVYQNEWNGGADKNIAAARVSKTGEVLGIFNIEPNSPTHSPDVAYSSQHNKYLVVWQDDTSGWPSVRGALVTTAGGVTSFDIAIGSNIIDYSVPAVAYASTSDNFLVVWQEHFAPAITHEIWGRVISSAGVPDPVGSFKIAGQDATSDYRKNPDVAYCRTRNEHLVVWEQRFGPGDYDIRARRVTGGGQPLNPNAFGISTSGFDEEDPVVAAMPLANGEGDYLVAWEIDTGGDLGVNAQTVHVDNTGNMSLATLKMFDDSVDETNPAVAANESNQHYLLTWTETDYALPFNFVGILGREIASDGTLLSDEDTAISGTYADQSAVAAGPFGDFLVAFGDQIIAAPDHDIYGRLWGNRIYLPVVLRS